MDAAGTGGGPGSTVRAGARIRHMLIQHSPASRFCPIARIPPARWGPSAAAPAGGRMREPGSCISPLSTPQAGIPVPLPRQRATTCLRPGPNSRGNPQDRQAPLLIKSSGQLRAVQERRGCTAAVPMAAPAFHFPRHLSLHEAHLYCCWSWRLRIDHRA